MLFMVWRQQQTWSSELGHEIPPHLGLARRLHELVSEHPDFEVLSEPSLNSYCFRYLPNGLVERQEEPEVQEALNRVNQEIVEIVRRNGLTSVMTTSARGCIAIQISICQQRTVDEVVDDMFEAIARWGRLLTKTHFVTSDQLAGMEELSCSSELRSSPMEV
jgi:glutamate/tyrosine decarboxylase-like PLP-dependent enzyme